MYKLLKEKGNNMNITIENADGGSIIIGRMSVSILTILRKAGFTFDDDKLSLRDKWELEITDELAHELQKEAMKISKPIRDQSVKKVPKKDNKSIDAMDVLLGLANYN